MTGRLETGRDLDAFLAAHVARPLARVLGAIAETALPIAHLIRRGGLAGDLDEAIGPDHDGTAQKALDVFADEAFVSGFRGAGVRAVLSEERDGPVALDSEGAFLVALDPLDGSNSIDANISIGTVFSVLDAPLFGKRGLLPR